MIKAAVNCLVIEPFQRLCSAALAGGCSDQKRRIP
jgi:hypothetical protein